MAWFAAILFAVGGHGMRPVLGVITMTASLWVIVAAIAAYQNKKAEYKSKFKDNEKH